MTSPFRRGERIDHHVDLIAGSDVIGLARRTTTQWLRRPVTSRPADRNLPSHFDRELHSMGAVLHDVGLPGAAHRLDHLVVAPSGIWLIDTVRIAGRIERRDVGGLRTPDVRLHVDRDDRTDLVDSLGVLRAARRAVDAMGFGVEVHRALCVVDATWSISARPFHVKDVWITWPRALTDKIRSTGMLPIRTALEIAASISVDQSALTAI